MKLREKFFENEENHLCRVRRPEGCMKVASEPHHPKGRGINLLNLDECIPVCRYCHEFCGNNPEWAEANGFSESRLSKGNDHPTE